MRVAVLTSSRADYGIYLPLLKKLREDHFFELDIIAFGTHLSKKFGNTFDQITNDGFTVNYLIDTLPAGDRASDISESMGKTMIAFAPIWKELSGKVDLVFCLGDRYEMFAAVASSAPFNIRVAHIHGGETTLGAIDEKFRHSLTSMSNYHFVSTETYAERVKGIIGKADHVYTVGALSLDNLKDIKLLTKEEFKTSYGVDMSMPTVLVTFHPETVAYQKNVEYCDTLIGVMREMKEQIIITMPNADTMGNLVREQLQSFVKANRTRVFGFESLGTFGYFSCMQHCAFLLGNTSSGIIEAASFSKYVINLGDRQKGRISGENVMHCFYEKSAIMATIDQVKKSPKLGVNNLYGDGKAADRIVEVLKRNF